MDARFGDRYAASMGLRGEIESVFEGKAFARPLFYRYPGGLRFGLSEGGSAMERFLLAMRKATEICQGIFADGSPLTVCLRARAGASCFVQRQLLAELRDAGVGIPKSRSLWAEPVTGADRLDEHTPEWWINAAFEFPRDLIQNVLWCALSCDCGVIRPRPACSIYLFNLTRRVMVLPYDDRGLDVVGPNHDFLSELYRKYSRHLLDHDRPTMDECFGQPG